MEDKQFRTPDEVAAADSQSAVNTSAAPVNAPSVGQFAVSLADEGQTSPRGFSGRLKKFFKKPFGKREWLISAAIVLFCGGAVGLILNNFGDKPVVSAKKVAPIKPAKSNAVPSNLSGLPVDPAVNQRPVTGVMVENSPSARPQAGLNQAGVVFEAIAEYGVTRFLALYQDTAPDVGPIRSARPYFAQWALGFDAGYAHVGGSPEALANIKAWGVKDLDQFANSGAYRRISSRAAPHNVYASVEGLTQLQAGKGYVTSKYTGFPRKAAKPAKQPSATKIDLNMSGPLYNVHYDYVAATNSYNRSQAGAPHTDANSGGVLSPKVVIAMVMPYSIQADGIHSNYGVLGSGPATIFQDGVVITGTWTKAANNSQVTFTDAAGKPIKLNPGQTWLTAVKAPGHIVAAP